MAAQIRRGAVRGEVMISDPEYLKLQLKEYQSLVRNNPKEKTGLIRDEIRRITDLLQGI